MTPVPRNALLYFKMHQKAFGGRALSGPAGGANSAPQPPSWVKEGEEGERGEGGEGRKLFRWLLNKLLR